MSNSKRNTLLFLSIAGVLVLLLAMSLPNLTLFSGRPLSFGQPLMSSASSSGILPGGDIILRLFQGFVALGLIALAVHMVYSLFSPAGRRRLMFYAVLVVLVFLFSNFLYSRRLQIASLFPPDTGNNQPQSGDQAGNVNTIDQFPRTPPAWLSTAIILVASLVGALIVLAALYYLRKRDVPGDTPFDRLAQQAETAIASIQAGGDFRSTIIRCYEDMNRIVKEEKGIARDSTMTPREFEERLISQGFGREAIQTLTRLFEKSRYGSMVANTSEETQAIAALTEIVNACKTLGNVRFS